MADTDFEIYEDDFVGAAVTFPTAANIGTPWLTVVTGAAPPTHVRGGSNATLSLTSASQVQILSLAHGDSLAFDIDDIQSIEMRLRLNAALTTGSILTFGIGSARADDADAVAAHATFRMVGATSTSAVFVESDDAVRDIDDIATGQTLGTTFKKFYIDFCGGKSDVKFYMDDAQGNKTRVAPNQVFNMSGYSAGLQPIVQLQKAANTNADVVTVDYVKIISKRRA